MNIAEEKKFLYNMMSDITEERRRLTDQYFSLKERLDALHKLEEKGLSDLSTKGFIDLFNDRETQQTIANMNREVQYAIARREEKQLQVPRFDKIAETLERGAADRSEKQAEIARLKAQYEAEEKSEVEERDRLFALEKAERQKTEDALIAKALQESEQVTMRLAEENAAKKSDAPVKNLTIPKELIEEAKDKEPKPVGRPKGATETGERKMSGLKTKEAIFLISKILKEHGTPMKAKALYNKLVEVSAYEIAESNFTSNIFQRVLKAEPRIERVSPGYYQFNKNATTN